MKINNKCREVLENILTNFPGGLGQYPEIYKQVIDVLKEPLRNCDVGDEKDQVNRYGRICNKYHKMKGMCINCPLYKDGDSAYDCYIRWSQMPYENKLKPCPFCGSVDIDYYETDFGADNPYSYVIRCNGCNAKVYIESGEYEDTVNAWNKRVYERKVES